jgi:putative PIN family toxin of toxin-antitoxin system
LRAVLDVNVIISALLSRGGAPADLLRSWQDGQFEVITSPLLSAELERALAYPKLRRRISADEADAVVGWLRRAATIAPDPNEPPPISSRDPGDDYLLALAAAVNAFLVSGDEHLLSLEGSLAGRLPIRSPAGALGLLERQR